MYNFSTRQRRRAAMIATTSAALGAVSLLTLALGAAPALAADSVMVIIDSPTQDQVFPPGKVTVSGHLTGGSTGDVASVIYVADLSGSTAAPTGNDCDGNGTAGDAGDNPNGDANIGDTADCEITGITALNDNLAAAAGSATQVQVGLVPFADNAVAADVDPALDKFVSPGQVTTPGPQADVITAANSMVQGNISQYSPFGVGGGTNFDAATMTALDTLALAPAGPKFIFFLSDGQASVAQSTLDALTASGADLRSFAIGGGATCTAGDALSQLAAATGQVCTAVTDPATLGEDILNSNPGGVDHLDVKVGGTVYPATLDVIGNWSIKTSALAPGAYTAVATATLVSGGTTDAKVDFTVVAPTTPPGSSTAPTGGSSTPTGPILAATGTSHVMPESLLALALLVGGSGLVVAGRRRRAAHRH